LTTLRKILFRSDRQEAPAAPAASPLAVTARAAEQAMMRYMLRRRQTLERQVGPRGCDALHLLPFLLHVNQPGLPGFVDADGCPAGITGYAPSNADLSLAQRLFPGARVRRSGVFSPAIDLVAVMGSVGTIGFTADSDLDVWVCHNRGIDKGATLRQYREKVQAVEAWLSEYAGLEIHLFLQATGRIADNDFGDTDVEGCGSAMGALLKEEFYRTGLRLAGRHPFWWLVPPDGSPQAYRDHVEQLHRDPTFATDEFVDLGWVARVPLGELFGAAVWQIVKGWKSPFKSALKMGLLEKAVHAESNRPLCEIIKEQVLAGEDPDPYRVLFEEVLAHYRGMQDTATEDLLARCFYLKTDVRLAPERLEPAAQGDPAATVLANYLREWGWGARRVRHLNEFEQWRFELLRGLAQEVDRYFLRTYKRIRSVLDACGESQRITPRDLTILGRKLQTIYRRAPHKIETVHQISRAAPEPLLSLYQEPLPDGESPWQLFRGRVTPLNVEESHGEFLHTSPDVAELLVWACLNGLLGPRTRLSARSVEQQVPAAAVESLAQEVLGFVAEAQRQQPPLEALLAPPRPTHLLVIPNLGLAGETLRELSAVYATSWGELFYQHWAGPGALRHCAEEVLFPFIQDSPSPRAIQVSAPLQKVGSRNDAAWRLHHEIPALVAQLVADDEQRPVKRRYVGSTQNGYFVCDRSGGQPIRFRSFATSDDLVRYLAGVGPHHRVETRVEAHGPELNLLRTLFETAVPGMIDVFWLEYPERDLLCVVDEVGNLTQFSHRPDDEPYALARLLVFLEGTLPEVAGHPENPLRAPILGEVIRIHTVATDGSCQVHTSTHELLGRVQSLGLDPMGLTIERTGDGGRAAAGYRITWGDQVFQSGEVENPLEEARRKIAEVRSSGLDYEVFLTRLFLDDRFQQQYCGSFATIGHYLFYKRVIEQRLSAPPAPPG
jgi:adenylate cyclase class 1